MAGRNRQNKTMEAEGSSLSSSLQNADCVKYWRTWSVSGMDSPHTPVPNGPTTHSEGCTDNRVHFAPSFHGYEPNACSNIFLKSVSWSRGTSKLYKLDSRCSQASWGVERQHWPAFASSKHKGAVTKSPASSFRSELKIYTHKHALGHYTYSSPFSSLIIFELMKVRFKCKEIFQKSSDDTTSFAYY